MSDLLNVEIIGVHRLAATLDVAAERIGDFAEANRAVAELIASEASARAPRMTGRLASSIKPGPAERAEAVVIADVYYAAFVEFGTMYMAEQPFMRPAVRDNQAAWMAAYQRVAEDILGSVQGA